VHRAARVRARRQDLRQQNVQCGPVGDGCGNIIDWQILAPTAASDAMMFGGVFGFGGPVGKGFTIAGAVVRGISGPIVHLVHGHPRKALGSFALEGVLPGIFAAVGLARYRVGTRTSARTPSRQSLACRLPSS
jgi:hypothetical protein